MLTTLVTIKAFIPKLEVSAIKQGDLDLLLKVSRTYSENISITKRTSANKNMTVTLADILETIKKMSKAKSQNDERHRLVPTETFKKQVDTTLSLHLKNMKMENDNNYQCYKFSDKLRGEKWRKYTMDALNMAVRDDFIKTLSFLGIFGEKIKPPVGLNFFNFTDDVPAETHKNKGQK
jgi:hypothetical protein